MMLEKQFKMCLTARYFEKKLFDLKTRKIVHKSTQRKTSFDCIEKFGH